MNKKEEFEFKDHIIFISRHFSQNLLNFILPKILKDSHEVYQKAGKVCRKLLNEHMKII